MEEKKVYIGSDHAGFNYKGQIVDHLSKQNYSIEDCGAYEYNKMDDYPIWIAKTAEMVVLKRESFGIILGGSGNGEAIIANKVRGIRAIVAWNERSALLGRQHNDANVISIGARFHSIESVMKMLKTFLSTDFSHEKHHTRRIEQIRKHEALFFN